MKPLATLKDIDLYSLALFALYKLSSIPEYSVVSELPYILDKDNLLNLCTYFGGTTIKIPTVSEINSIMHLILLYQYVKIEGKDYNEAIELIGFKSSELRNVKSAFNNLCATLDKYSFGGRTNGYN